MSTLASATSAVQAAASAAGDASGNCDEAAHVMAAGMLPEAAERMEWAEENARSALHRITEARAAIARAMGAAS